MQKRTRRQHGIKSRKVSISVSADDLRLFMRRARQKHGGNLSAVIHELAGSLRREEAADRLFRLLGNPKFTEEELARIREEIERAPTGYEATRRRPRQRRRAA